MLTSTAQKWLEFARIIKRAEKFNFTIGPLLTEKALSGSGARSLYCWRVLETAVIDNDLRRRAQNRTA
jgi:hypothetical protein